MHKKNIISMGLPSSGKTTYLAALWHLLDSGENDTQLELIELPNEGTYLNEIRDRWLKCKVPERTNTNSVNYLTLKIRAKKNNEKIEMLFPDLSGETFQTQQWEKRIIAEEYLDLIGNVANIILFIHPTNIEKPIPIIDPKIFKPEDESVEQILPWEPHMAPTQVVLVDLLQFIFYAKPSLRKLNLCTVFSAWDLVGEPHEGITPDYWLEKELPLLDQFLQANTKKINYRCYGISAQGGDFAKDKASLLPQEPSKRLYILDEKSKHFDITIPISWLIENAE